MMRGPRSSGASNLLLGLVCLLLGGVVWLEIEAAPRLLPPDAPPPDPVPAAPPLPAAAAFQPPPIAAFEEVMARPLFAPSRQPPPDAPDAPALAAPPAPELGFELVGVVISPEEALALVRQPGMPDLVRAGIGRTVAGWTVERIEPDRVLFRAGDSVEELVLRDDVPEPPPETARERRARRADELREERERRAEELLRQESERLESETRAILEDIEGGDQ
jgi:general secretion pathway protein N